MVIVVAALWMGLGVGVLLTLAGLLAPVYPPLEMPNHFRPWIVLGCLGLVMLQLAVRARRLWPWLAALGGLNLVLLAAPLGLEARPAGVTTSATLRLVSLNVWVGNRRLSDVAAWLAQSDADIVVLQELPPRNANVLLPMLRAAYPHQVACSRCRNLALLSRRPWIEVEEQVVSPAHPGMIRAHFAGPGAGFHLVVLHPSYPFQPFQQARDYRWLTELLARQRGSLIVVGDLNVTPWTWTMWRLQRAAGLVRHGTWARSWSSHLPLQTFLIDNVLTTPDIRSVSFRTGPHLGSDHLPIIATLAPP